MESPWGLEMKTQTHTALSTTLQKSTKHSTRYTKCSLFLNSSLCTNTLSPWWMFPGKQGFRCEQIATTFSSSHCVYMQVKWEHTRLSRKLRGLGGARRGCFCLLFRREVLSRCPMWASSGALCRVSSSIKQSSLKNELSCPFPPAVSSRSNSLNFTATSGF